MPRPVLPVVALLLMIPGTSLADAPGATDPAVADPADPVESTPTQATENRVAFAGPPGTAEVQLPPPAPVPAVPTGLIANRDADAAAGRAFLTPTAITGRKGSVRVDTWFPTLPIAGFAVASYSVTNRLEIGAGGMWVLDEGDESLAAIRIKFAALRAKRGGIAVEYQHVFTDDELVSVLSVVGSHCVDAGCRTLLSLHVTAVPEFATYVDDNDTFGDTLHVFGGASIVTGGKVKLVADLLTIEDSGDRVLAGYAGVRLTRPRWALDAGMVAGGENGDFEALPVPLVAASARW